MTIDNNTGLPELPEGYFWRIAKSSVSIQKKLPDTEWRLRGWSDVLSRGVEYRERPEEKTVKAFGIFPRKETVITYEVRYVNRSEEVVSVDTELSGEIFPSKEQALEFARRGASIPNPVELRKDITRADVLPMCEKALEKWDVRKILGDYPPMKWVEK